MLGRALEAAAQHSPRTAAKSSLTYEALLAEKVLAPLGSAHATFDTAGAIRDDLIAVGTSEAGEALDLEATCQPAAGAPGSWTSPCGCLCVAESLTSRAHRPLSRACGASLSTCGAVCVHRWASAADVAELLKLFFRSDEPADAGRQIVDGDSLREMLAPSVLLRDGSSAVGSPWEMKYSSGVWIQSKQGELPGYRSSGVPSAAHGSASLTIADEPSSGMTRAPLPPPPPAHCF